MAAVDGQSEKLAQYRDEHPDLFTLNLQAGLRHIAAWFRQVGGSATIWWTENRHSSFPESEHGAAQLFLFFWNSLSRLGASLRERARNARKKLIRASDRRRSYFEKLKLHPVAFLAGAMGLAAAATVLSLYTVGRPRRLRRHRSGRRVLPARRGAGGIGGGEHHPRDAA